MKKTLKIFIFSIIMLCIFGLTSVKAATASISASKTTATVGDNVTITVNINAAAWNVKVNGSGISDVIAGYNEDAVNTTKTKTYTLNTNTAGTYTVKISGDVTDENDSKAYPNQSVTVTVNNPAPKPPVNNGGTTTNPNQNGNSNTNRPNNNGTATKPNNNTNTTNTPKKSNNSKLSSLQIAEGAITPEFNSSVKEYSIIVPNEITNLSISAIADSSKATVRIVGNEELQVGENNIEVIVTAEDGSNSTYKIVATRAVQELNLSQLNIHYINEEGNKIDLKLEPEFASNIYEYNILEKLSHKIEKLEIEAVSTRESAKVEILGNEKLKSGKNEIIIQVVENSEREQEEKKIYKIIVEKEEAPIIVPLTTMQKIQNWFTGAGSTIGKWATENFQKILSGTLLIASTALAGLTVYFVVDYKNYKKVLEKLAELNKTNLMERANVALDPEKADLRRKNCRPRRKYK